MASQDVDTIMARRGWKSTLFNAYIDDFIQFASRRKIITSLQERLHVFNDLYGAVLTHTINCLFGLVVCGVDSYFGGCGFEPQPNLMEAY